MLRQSTLWAPCDQCRLPFDPTYGGVCKRCKRLLCPTHLYGSFWRRMRGRLGLHETCVRCREELSGSAP